MVNVKFSQLPAASPLSVDAMAGCMVAYKRADISSVQLLDLHNTSVEILPAPGANKFYFPHKVFGHFHYNTTQYDGGGVDFAVALQAAGLDPYMDDTALKFSQFDNGAINTILGAETKLFVIPSAMIGIGITDPSEFTNKALELSLGGPDHLTLGNSTLSLHLYYSIADLS